MSTGTSIEWTDATWSPVRGCSRVSEGCRNCYAERIAVRFSHEGAPYEGFADVSRRHSETGRATTGVRGHWTGRVELIPEKLEEPLRWRKPRRVFVNSMSDLFHEALSFQDIARVYGIMAIARRHTFQVLTKRPARRLDFHAWRKAHREDTDALGFNAALACEFKEWPLSNVWEGVSVEDQMTADERIPPLLQTPAAVRFVSLEPLLGPVALEDDLRRRDVCQGRSWLKRVWRREETAWEPALDWVIVGGESGPGARPCDVAWIRSALRQCREAGVPVFVKQLGTRSISSDDDDRRHCGDMNLPAGFRMLGLGPKGNNPSDWPEDLRVREFPS